MDTEEYARTVIHHLSGRVMLLDRARRIFTELYDIPCWGVHYGQYSNLRLHFGEPWLHTREPVVRWDRLEPFRIQHKRMVTVKGQWLLWIYSGDWTLLLGDKPVARNKSSKARKARGAAILNGQKLTHVDVSEETCTTQFHFDLGCTLNVTRRDTDSDLALWMLYRPNGYVFKLNTDGTIEHRRSASKRLGQEHDEAP